MRAQRTILLGILCIALSSAARSQSRPIDVPAQDLRAALNEYIHETGVDLVYCAEDVKGKRSTGVRGASDKVVALENLLKGTGLTAGRDTSGAVIVAMAAVPGLPMAVEPPASHETITVTGSRVITSNDASPTPLATISLRDLSATTPSNIPDALNKFPMFLSSRSQRTAGGNTADWSANMLNLRAFGTNRALVLLDGMRLTAADSSNNIDVNLLPQAFVQRVDVVTGGASAAYGSDAVTGVINFVLDRDFDGVSVDGLGGISGYGDDASWRFRLKAGGRFISDKVHAEFSYEHYSSDGIDSMMARPLGHDVYMEMGSGTAENPYFLAKNARNVLLTPGGYISSGPLAGQYFAANGVLAPFTHGTSASGVNEIGGDGGYGGMGQYLFPGAKNNPWLIASLKNDQWFGRLDADVSPALHVFLQANYSQSANYNVYYVQSFTATFAADNAFLPTSAKTALAASGTSAFSMSRALYNETGEISDEHSRNYNIVAGAGGALPGGVDWDLHYTHGQTQLNVKSPDTLNMQRLFAALDAVSSPVTGEIVCRVSLTAAGTAAYPGCVPFNAFGPSAESEAAFRYVTDMMSYRTTNTMNDVAASFRGHLFDGPAGPVNAALSFEYRAVSLETRSQYSPTAKVDCTAQNPATCSSSVTVWNGALAAMPKATENVVEGAFETNVPVLHDLPLISLFQANFAVRYTRYSTSGQAITWKVGGVWDVTDAFKVRGTQSRDIRAPTLNNLFAQANANSSAFADYLTGISGSTTYVFRANPDLKPEVSYTTTAGFIYQPKWLDGISLSADWYDIGIHNVIVSVNGGSTSAEQACIASEGTSKYCALVTRPNPISDRSAANYPTYVIQEAMNNGVMTTHGIDTELSYRFEVGKLWEDVVGHGDLRLMFSYQPSLLSVSGIPGAAVTNQAGAASSQGFSVPSGRLVALFNLTADPFVFSWLERWHSSERVSPDPTLVYLDPKVPQIFYADLAVRYRLSTTPDAELSLTIENLFDQQPTPYIGVSRTGAEGYAYPASFDQDVVGRYFTLGLHCQF